MLTIRVAWCTSLFFQFVTQQQEFQDTHLHYDSMPSTRSGGVVASFKKRFLQSVKKTTHGVLGRNRSADAAASYAKPRNLNPVIPNEFARAGSIAEVSTSGDKMEDEDQVPTISTPLPPSKSAVVEKPSPSSVQEWYSQTPSPTPGLQLEAPDVTAVPLGTPLQFEGEDERYYTDGPVRLIAATDATRSCAALLMNLDLSKKIQAAIRCERDFERHGRKTMTEQEGLIDFVAQLRIDIEERERHLSALEQDPDVEHGSMDVTSETKQCQEQLDDLRILLQEAEARQSSLETSLQTQAQELRHRQAQVSAYLEEAFVNAQLLSPADDCPDSPSESSQIDQEVSDLCLRMHKPSGASTASPPNPTASQEKQQALETACYNAYDRLNSARQTFSDRNRLREEERLLNEIAAENDQPTTDSTREALDVRWVKRFQEMTRELIEAEEGLAQASARAAEESVEIQLGDEALSSGFGDDGEGYAESVEREMVKSAPTELVLGWMTGVLEDDQMAEDQQHVADEWEADEVEFGDAASAYAIGKEKSKIERWRTMCKP